MEKIVCMLDLEDTSRLLTATSGKLDFLFLHRKVLRTRQALGFLRDPTLVSRKRRPQDEEKVKERLGPGLELFPSPPKKAAPQRVSLYQGCLLSPRDLEKGETLGPRIYKALSQFRGLDLNSSPPKIWSENIKSYVSNVSLCFHPTLPIAFVQTRRNEFKVLNFDATSSSRRSRGCCFFNYKFRREISYKLLSKDTAKRIAKKTYKYRYGYTHIASACWNPTGSLLMVQTSKADIQYLERCDSYFNELTEHGVRYKKHLQVFELVGENENLSMRLVKPGRSCKLKVDFCLAGSQLWLDAKSFILPGAEGAKAMKAVTFSDDHTEAEIVTLVKDCYNPCSGVETNWDSGHNPFEDRNENYRFVGNYTAVPTAISKVDLRSVAAVTNCPHMHGHDRVVVFAGPFPLSLRLRCNVDVPGQVQALFAEIDSIVILYSANVDVVQSEQERCYLGKGCSVSFAAEDLSALLALSAGCEPKDWPPAVNRPEPCSSDRSFYARTCSLHAPKALLSSPDRRDEFFLAPEAEAYQDAQHMVDRFFGETSLRSVKLCTRTWKMSQSNL